MTLIKKIKASLFGYAHYDSEIQIKNLDELVEFLDNFKIPKKYNTTFIHLNTPIQIQYIDNQSFTPICDKDILKEKYELINGMANYHLKEKLDFYSGIREPNESEDCEIQMFSNYLLKKHFKLKVEDTLIIPNPKIIISSQNRIAFPAIYDERTFTLNNLEEDRKQFNYQK